MQQRNAALAERYRVKRRKRYEDTLVEFGRAYPTLRHDAHRCMAMVRELWDVAAKAHAVDELRALFALHYPSPKGEDPRSGTLKRVVLLRRRGFQ